MGPKFKSACYHGVWRWGSLFLRHLFYLSFSVLYYLSLLHLHTSVFVSSALPSQPLPEHTDFISDAMCQRSCALEGSSSHGIVTLLCPHHLSPLPSHLSASSLIASTFPPSVLSALAIYNMALSCLWQMKKLPDTTNCSPKPRAVTLCRRLGLAFNNAKLCFISAFIALCMR